MSDTIDLVCVSGLSPAIVTETVWALAVGEGRRVREVHVLTTTTGREKLRGVERVLAQMRLDYPEAADRIPTGFTIEVPEDASGEELADVSDADASAVIGDALTRLVRVRTEADAPRLHASLAGGRKTMSFYMGAVMSALARDTDELSHVLVSPVEFERTRGFHYPTPEQRDQVDVILHRVPFVRTRELMSPKQLARVRTFGDLVDYAQRAAGQTEVEVRQEGCEILVDGAPFDATPVERAILAALLVGRTLTPRGFSLADELLYGDDLIGRMIGILHASGGGDTAKFAQLARPAEPLSDGAKRRASHVSRAIRKHVSTLNSRLDEALAPYAARRLRVENVGGHRAACYRVPLDSDAITLRVSPDLVGSRRRSFEPDDASDEENDS